MFRFLFERWYCLLFAALACGVALGQHWPLPGNLLAYGWWLYWLLMVCLLVCWWIMHYSDQPTLLKLLPFAIVAMLGFGSASLSVRLAQHPQLADWTGYDPQQMTGRVTSIPRLRNGHLRFKMELRQIDAVPVNGSCIVYLKSDEPLALYYSDTIRLFGTLDEIEPPKNHGEFDYRSYLQRKGTVFTAYAVSSKCLTRITTAEPWPYAWIDRARVWLTSNVRNSVPGELGELAVSVVFGDRITEISDETQSRFRRAGLTHILVASGTQVSLVVALVSLLFWRFQLDFSWRGFLKGLFQFVITMGVVLCYSAITGFETSIVRALSMGTLVLAGRLLHREADGLSVLAQSGIVLLMINPLELYSAGFQLSFGATFGLIYLIGVVHPIYARAGTAVKAVAGMLASTGGAQLFVAPLLAASFHQLSVWGMFSNLLAIPLAFFLLIGGALLSVGMGTVPLAGKLLGFITTGLSWVMNIWAGWFAALPGSDIAVPHQPLWWTIACYGLILLLAEWFKNREALSQTTRRWLFVTSCAMGTAVISPVLGWLLVPQPGLSVLALDGGQAYIWRSYSGRTVVLAVGERFNVRHNADKLMDGLRWRGINRIHHWYWLDSKGSLPDEIDSVQIDGISMTGGITDEQFDMHWCGDRTNPTAVVFGLGDKLVQLCWQTDSLESQRNGIVDQADWIIDGAARQLLATNGDNMVQQEFEAEITITPRALRNYRN